MWCRRPREIVYFCPLWPRIGPWHSSCQLRAKKHVFSMSLQKGTNKSKAKLAVSADVSDVFPFHPLYFTPTVSTIIVFLKPPLSERRAITHSSPGTGGLRDAYRQSDGLPPYQNPTLSFFMSKISTEKSPSSLNVQVNNWHSIPAYRIVLWEEFSKHPQVKFTAFGSAIRWAT